MTLAIREDKNQRKFFKKPKNFQENFNKLRALSNGPLTKEPVVFTQAEIKKIKLKH